MQGRKGYKRLHGTRSKAIGMRRKITKWNLRSQRLYSALAVVSDLKSDETGKRVTTDVGRSEWPGSDDGKDNITFLERGAILRPCLECELKCETSAM
jgi:hypothetical protein